MAAKLPLRAVALSSALCLSPALFPTFASAQDCTPADISLGTQTEVDRFQADHGPCDRVTGELKIDGADISSLTGLSGLTQVSRLFVQNNSSLADLRGLETLTRIDILYISHNEVLVSMKGLDGLDRVGDLSIRYNPSLRNMEGLSGLTRVGGGYGFEISGNSALESLDGLESLNTIVATLTIQDNNALTNIDGLSSLTLVTIEPVYKIEIQRNATLLNLDGLSSLTSLQGALIIHLNDSLADLHGLSNLNEVGALLHIAANPQLADLDGLEALTSVGALGIVNNATLNDMNGLAGLQAVASWLEISSNPSLASCQGIVTLIDPLDDYEPGPGPGISGIPDIAGQATIVHNSDGCESVNAILGEVPLFKMNAGLNDAWFSPDTDGQGFLIIVFPQIEQVFMAWFTYDIERPPANVTALLGEPGHRWLTAQGGYEENEAWLDAHMTSGGVFDSREPETVTVPDGEILLEFSSCDAGTVSYDLPSINRQGVVPIERIALDNIALCYSLGKQ